MSDRNLKEPMTGTRQVFVSQSRNYRQLSEGKEALLIVKEPCSCFVAPPYKYIASTLGSNMAAPAPALTTAFHLLEKEKRNGEGSLS